MAKVLFSSDVSMMGVIPMGPVEPGSAEWGNLPYRAALTVYA